MQMFPTVDRPEEEDHVCVVDSEHVVVFLRRFSVGSL